MMSDFLDRADGLRREGKVRFSVEDLKCFDLVFKAINALRAAHSKAELDTDNLESVWA